MRGIPGIVGGLKYLHSLVLSSIVGCMFIRQNIRECLLVCDTECFKVVFVPPGIPSCGSVWNTAAEGHFRICIMVCTVHT